MRSGGLRNVISVQRKVRMGKTPAGEDKIVWQTWRDGILCEIDVKRGREQFDPGTKQRFNEDVYRFRTRYGEVEGVDATMRIVDENGAIYDIKALLPDRQRTSDAVIEATLQNSSIGPKALIIELLDTVPPATVGVAFAGFKFSASGGNDDQYYFQYSSGTFPPGLAIEQLTGIVSGIPTQAGTFTFVAIIQDADNSLAELPEMSIIVTA